MEVVEDRNLLSDMQFGFRKGLPTIDGIQTVIQMAREAIKGRDIKKKYCAVITLDIKNAFNSASWDEIQQ